MNDSRSVRQIERGSYAPHYRKSSAWIFLSSDDSKSSASSFPSGGGPEASVDLCLSLLTSGVAARNDAGASDEIPQGFLIKIGNHEAFRRTFRLTGLNHCVLCNRRINQFGHDFTLSPSMAAKYGMYSVFSKCDSKRVSSVEGFLFDVFVSPATRASKTPHPNRQ